MNRTFFLVVFLVCGTTTAMAGETDKSARYGPLDSQSGSLVDATPGTKHADQRSPCERLKGKEKVSCLKKKPKQLESSSGSSVRQR